MPPSERCSPRVQKTPSLPAPYVIVSVTLLHDHRISLTARLANETRRVVAC